MCNLEVYLRDKKEDIYPKTPLDMIMVYYRDSNIFDLEKKQYNEIVYKKLGWSEENYFDVISSFWIIFQHIVFTKNDGFKVTKKTYPSMYFSEKYGKGIQRNINQLCKMFEGIVQLSKLCHSIANFMPCPSNGFNHAKGCLEDVNDFFPLMIDKIQECIDTEEQMKYSIENRTYEVDLDTIKKWHKFFIDNYSNYCLDMYYSIKECNNQQKIVGINFFKGQSLKYPLPKGDDEIKECLDKMISCIKIRAKKICDLRLAESALVV